MQLLKIFGILLQEGESLPKELEKEVMTSVATGNETVKEIFLGGHVCGCGALLFYSQATGNYFCRACDRTYKGKDFVPKGNGRWKK